MPETPSIPGYDLLEKLGSGTAGTVYKARQVSMDRPVAVKVLPPALADDERFIERFYREARAVAKLNHPNIVTGIDVGSAGAGSGEWLYYFVMEYVDGEEAGERVAREGPLPEAEALAITKQMAQALDHAFRNGIVHRDIKPANIMLTKDGVAKLADLGVAKHGGAVGSPSNGGVAGGSVFGTPYYMSPEQARAEMDIDIRSDIYSLGATLYHLLTGRPPFHGDPPAVVMAKQIAEEPEDIRGLNPKVSKALAALVTHMTAKNREERPEMPSDLIAEIDRIAKGHPLPGVHTPPRHAAHHVRADHQTGVRRRIHAGGGVALRAKGVVAGAVLAGTALVVVLVLALSTGSHEEKSKAPPVTPGMDIEAEENPAGRGPAPRRTPPKVDGEAGAQKLFAAALKKGVDREEGLKRLREVIARFPGTKVAARAAEHAGRLKAELDAAEARRDRGREIDRLRKRAKDLIEKRELASAVEAVDPSRTGKPLREALGALRKEILNLGVLEIARAEARALSLSKEGKVGPARRLLKALKVDGVSQLEARLAQALARVDEVASERAEAARRSALLRAEEAYTALCEKVNAELREFRAGEARHLLNSALAGQKLSPVRDRLAEDLEHVGYFEDVVKAALRGVEFLTGQTRSFAMRGGTIETGKIGGVTGTAIEVESRIMGAPGGGVVSRRVELSHLSDRQIAELALITLENDRGDTFLKLAVLYSVGGDLRAARRQIQKARELGADVASVQRRWIVTARDELDAAKLLKEARAHFKAKRYTECRRLLTELKEKYSHTEVYKANYSRPVGSQAPDGRRGPEGAKPAPGSRGKILREYWLGVPGRTVAESSGKVSFARKPAGRAYLDSFAHSSTGRQDYVARVRGYVVTPMTGEHVFWVTSDNGSELWLSTDETAAKKRKIASCPDAVQALVWEEHASQRSKPVRLSAGKAYYVEVLHKQGPGKDHLAVGWRLPNGTLERPIPGRRLAPPE